MDETEANELKSVLTNSEVQLDEINDSASTAFDSIAANLKINSETVGEDMDHLTNELKEFLTTNDADLEEG